MTRVLVVADEVAPVLYTGRLLELRPDLVLSAGDLPFDYLEYLVTMTNAPLLYVPGNDDPNLDPRGRTAPLGELPNPFFLGDLEDPPGPRGCINVDLDVVEAAGVRVAGLGGSIRYSDGPNQYTEREMAARARRLRWRAFKRGVRRRPLGAAVDVLLTHSPPRGTGDGSDPAHRGFQSLQRLMKAWMPRLLVHGHVHPYGPAPPDRRVGATTVVNAVAYRMLEV